jgi:hypothetical protein
MNINFEKTLQILGGVASDTTDYASIKRTWDAERSSKPKCPPFGEFVIAWNDLVYSGKEVGTWKQEREKAYAKEGLNIQESNDLIMEYNIALAAGDLEVANKYKDMLEIIHVKRQEIKARFPKS